MRRKNRLAGSTSCELPLPPLCSFRPESAGGTISFSLALSADIAKHFWDSVHYWGGSQTPELMDEVSWAELSLPKSFRSHLGMGSAPAFIHLFALFMNVMPPLLIQSKSGCQALSNLHLPPPKFAFPSMLTFLFTSRLDKLMLLHWILLNLKQYSAWVSWIQSLGRDELAITDYIVNKR